MSTASPHGRLALAASPLVAAVLLVTAAQLGPAPVRAASCNSPAHQISLSSGSVSPGSGTTATSFTFSVTYRSNEGCAPTKVEVVIAGVGTYSMAGSGTNYVAGVTYRRTMTLPPGSRAYSFRAAAGSKSGYDTATLTSVSPSALTVVSPTATPAPATPRPTPPPTLPPPAPTVTPTATPIPTPKATPPSSVSTPAQPSTAATTPTPTPVPSHGGGVGPVQPGDGPGAGGSGGTAGGGDPSLLDGAAIFGRMAVEMPGLTIWLIATAGGLCLFMGLNRPVRPFESIPQTGTVAMLPQEADQTVAEPLVMPPTAGEGRMPRWLRPSVQAARHAEPGREHRRGDG